MKGQTLRYSEGFFFQDINKIVVLYYCFYDQSPSMSSVPKTSSNTSVRGSVISSPMISKSCPVGK